MLKRLSTAVLSVLVSAGILLSAQAPQTPAPPAQPPSDPQSFKFRTGIELINVNATVTDQSGRFVPGLTKDDFRVYDDEQLVTISHFNSERVPVSLGIVLDTSGSMDGEKMYAARQALDRFLFQLLNEDDEVFLYRFDNAPELVEGWTHDKRRISESLGRIQPRGGTALYDTVIEAVKLAQQGHNRKKAVLIISDGNDTSSRTDVFAVKQLIRETEVLVYAIGIDSAGSPYVLNQAMQRGGPPRFLFRSRCRAAVVPRRHRRSPSRRRVRSTAATRVGETRRAKTASTSPRCVTSPTTAAGAPRSSAGRAISIPPHQGSPTN
jgi:Ca-activated chloride channel family protein